MKTGTVEPADLKADDITPEENLKPAPLKPVTMKPYGNLKKLTGDRIGVRLFEDVQRIGMIHLPEDRKDVAYKSRVAQVVAVGSGSLTKREEVDVWLEGSKRWGKAVKDTEVKAPIPHDVRQGDYVLFLHPYVAADYVLVEGLTDEELAKYRNKDVDFKKRAKVFIISGFEVICTVHLEEDEKEDKMRHITTGRICMV